MDSTHFAQGGGTWNANKTHDGVTLILNGITGTGTLQVYGYSKGGLTQPQTIQPFSMSAGTTGTIAAGGNATVTFPVGRFTAAPIVTATSNAASSTNARVALISPVSSTGFTIYNVSGNTGGFMWQAIQMTSSSGGG
jgi:hypothetical protein